MKKLMQWFYGMFKIPFEEDSIVFKIKVKKGKQNYGAICWYKVYGFWKFKYDFTWNKLGIIYEKKEFGIWKDEFTSEMLHLCHKVFVANTRSGIEHSRTGSTMEVNMRELIAQIDSETEVKIPTPSEIQNRLKNNAMMTSLSDRIKGFDK